MKRDWSANGEDYQPLSGQMLSVFRQIYYSEEFVDDVVTFNSLMERLGVRSSSRRLQERRRLRCMESKGWISFDEENQTITCTVKGRRWFRALEEEQRRISLRRLGAELRAV